uniref:Uncharacterized protein n=1 Tax=Haptolina brevifila TaxID=156173 RepID=A0A7S2N3B5_9EUKA
MTIHLLESLDDPELPDLDLVAEAAVEELQRHARSSLARKRTEEVKKRRQREASERIKAEARAAQQREAAKLLQRHARDRARDIRRARHARRTSQVGTLKHHFDLLVDAGRVDSTALDQPLGSTMDGRHGSSGALPTLLAQKVGDALYSFRGGSSILPRIGPGSFHQAPTLGPSSSRPGSRDRPRASTRPGFKEERSFRQRSGDQGWGKAGGAAGNAEAEDDINGESEDGGHSDSAAASELNKLMDQEEVEELSIKVGKMINALTFVDTINSLLDRRLLLMPTPHSSLYEEVISWEEGALQALFSGVVQYMRAGQRYGLLQFDGHL